MTDQTPLDVAHAAMEADPADDAARLRFYERLAETELFLMLETEAGDDSDQITPELFELDNARFVLVFDRQERLAGFAGGMAPFVSLSGRSVAGMLQGQGIGLAVNPDVAPSSILLPEEAVAWLNGILANQPDETEARIVEVRAPGGLPETLISALDAKLATAMGLALHACLVGVRYSDDTAGHLLVFVGAVPGAETALARAAGEALSFSGIDAGAMDVAFFRADEPMAERLERAGLRFDLPQAQEATALRPAPGSDPARPPKLT